MFLKKNCWLKSILLSLAAGIIIGCQFGPMPKSSVFNQIPAEYIEGQFIIEADGPWCPWPADSCPTAIGGGNYIMERRNNHWLITPEMKPLNSDTKILVPYDADQDLCQTEFAGTVCSPNYTTELYTPNDPRFERGELWGLGPIPGADAVAAWQKQTGKAEIVVAVIDTGIEIAHPDLRERIWTNEKEIPGNGIDDDRNGYIDDYHGVDIVAGKGNGDDQQGHGTHVAGSICATGNNDQGVVGVNWKCSLLPVKIFGASGGGSYFDALRGIDYVTDLRKRGVPIVVANNSWGGRGYSQPLENAVARAIKAGVVFVAAAGNSGSDNQHSPHYPSNFEDVLAVAAIARDGRLASFSNYGDPVHIGAPGVQILSTYPGSRYSYLQGTSMAAPHVSGAVALLSAQHPNLDRKNLQKQILDTAASLPSLKGKVTTGGTLDAANALQAEPDPVDPEPPTCKRKKYRKCWKNCKRTYESKRKRRKCRKNCRQTFHCPPRWWESLSEFLFG